MSQKQSIAIFWFRQDLRLADNPGLTRAFESGLPVLTIYIRDQASAGNHINGAASDWWLHFSLSSLNSSLNQRLNLYQGDAWECLQALIQRFDVKAVFWNRCYEPWRIQRDRKIKQNLQALGISVSSENGSLLWEPWQIKKADGTPYQVFTPFYRYAYQTAPPPRYPLEACQADNLFKDPQADSLDTLVLLPQLSWADDFHNHWTVGESAAQDVLTEFLHNGIQSYKEGRDFPAIKSVSRLSPYLHFGEISPHQVWHAARSLDLDKNIEHFCKELGWREFSYSLLFNQPGLPEDNLQSKFDAFPWRSDSDQLSAWQQGQTGIPIVDAGMRELWQTGYMHNRVRMIVASFLVKNLRLDWRLGAKWFWDCLLDADLANNSASWQWVAGCGADAAPYFRIFNPVTQGQKFDTEGKYCLQYVPELTGLSKKYLFNPWLAPAETLKIAGIKLGTDYPEPIVDLKLSREDALLAFQSLKNADTT